MGDLLGVRTWELQRSGRSKLVRFPALLDRKAECAGESPHGKRKFFSAAGRRPRNQYVATIGIRETIYVFRTQSEVAALRRQIQLTAAGGANRLENTPDEAIPCMAEDCRGDFTELL